MAKSDAPKPMIEGHTVEKFDKSNQFHRTLIGNGMKKDPSRGDVPIYPGGYLSYDKSKWTDVAPKEKKASTKKAAAPKKEAAVKPAAKTTKKAAAPKTSTKKTK